LELELNPMKSGFFLVSAGIAWVIGHYFGNGTVATLASILISYHAYLAFLVLIADHETGFSMPVLQTIVTHLACLAIVVSLGLGRHYIPFFGLIRLFIPALAPFEITWLFAGGAKKLDPTNDPFTGILLPSDSSVPATAAPMAAAPNALAAVTPAASAAPAPSLYMNSSSDDFEEFRVHLSQPKRPFRKPGMTVKEEYEAWLAHRAKTRAANASAAQTA
jgi:hypothetical protein